MEAECHQLDLELAQHTTSALPGDRQSFTHYCTMIKELADLTEKKNELTMYLNELNMGIGNLVTLTTNSPMYDSLREEAVSVRRQLEDTVS